MRKLKGSTFVSLDGVIGEPHLWASERFDDEARAGALAQLGASDAMLMGSTLYVDLANPWDADVTSLGLLSPFMATRGEETGEQVFEDDRFKMRRSWHSRAANESLEVSFTYDITTRTGARIAHYDAQSRWLRVRPDFLLNELQRLGVVVSNTLGHHDGRQYVPGAPRFIADWQRLTWPRSSSRRWEWHI